MEAQKLAAWRQAKEAEERAAAALNRGMRAQEETRNAEQKAEQERVARRKAEEETHKAIEAIEKGIAPVKWPTPEEVNVAKAAIKYNAGYVHLAVCGSGGSGKSSLINALRGVSDLNTSAAAVGVVESTVQLGRYLDPRTEFPHSRMVWYDVPGAGTRAVSDWQYFFDQRLFIFDFIIMIYDIRFTKIDVGIIENCLRFKIPVIVVRSKADQHIQNLINDEERVDEEDSEDNYEIENDKRKEEERKKRCREKYIQITRENFQSSLQQMISDRPQSAHHLLLTQELYLVSCPALRAIAAADARKKRKFKDKVIDEVRLVEAIRKVTTSKLVPQ